DGGVGADAERQRGHRRKGERRALRKHAQRLLEVADEGIHWPLDGDRRYFVDKSLSAGPGWMTKASRVQAVAKAPARSASISAHTAPPKPAPKLQAANAPALRAQVTRLTVSGI